MALLTSRARILEKAGFDSLLSGGLPSPGDFEGVAFAVAILCQSFGSDEACAIGLAVQQRSPTTLILRIGKRSEIPEPCFEHRLMFPSPATLIAAVQQLAFGAEPLVKAQAGEGTGSES